MSLPSAALANLRNSFSGDIITPGDDRYDGARRVWNAIIDKRPALIARPRNADDVSACVRFAVEQQLPVAVRGGAHSIAGRGTCDDGIVIDFADMKNVVVDRDARTAPATLGARWEETVSDSLAHVLVPSGVTTGTHSSALLSRAW